MEAGRRADERLVDDLVAVVGPVRGDGKRAVERDPALVLAVVIHDVELFVPAPVAVGAEDDPGQERPRLARELPDDVVGDDVRHPPDRDAAGRVRLPQDRAQGPQVEELRRDDDVRPLRPDLGVEQELGAGGDPGVALLARGRRPEPLRMESGIRQDEPGRGREVPRQGLVEGVDELTLDDLGGRRGRGRHGQCDSPASFLREDEGDVAGLRGRRHRRSGLLPGERSERENERESCYDGSETHRGPPAVLHWKRMWTPSSSRRNSGGRGGSGLAE